MIFFGNQKPEFDFDCCVLQLGFTSPTQVAIIRDLNLTIAQVSNVAVQLYKSFW